MEVKRRIEPPGPDIRILIVAGEASGDLHGARVAQEITRLDPKIRVFAMGGSRLRESGAEVLIDSSVLAVVGITEVLARLGGLAKALSVLKEFISKRRPKLLILIDFPDFNLILARTAKAAGVPVLYYISPQVWAWRSGRVKKIARRVERMAVIFPFEVAIYRRAGVETEFVGHPLLDQPALLPDKFPPPPAAWRGDPLIALLPGSRPKEVRSLLPEMIRAAEIISGGRPQARYLLAAAPAIAVHDLRRCLPSTLPVEVVEGQTYAALRAADLAIVASGTATLEAAILEKPMIILYRVSPLSHWIGRRLVKVRWIGLANLIAGRGLVPELIQGEARGERIAEEALRILSDEAGRREMVAGLGEVRKILGSPGAARRVAGMAMEMIRRSNK